LKNEHTRVFREIDDRSVVAIRNHDRMDGILISPAPLRLDWQALNELLAALPVKLTHGEDGAPLPDLSGAWRPTSRLRTSWTRS
jgi:hypothetical protein